VMSLPFRFAGSLQRRLGLHRHSWDTADVFLAGETAGRRPLLAHGRMLWNQPVQGQRCNSPGAEMTARLRIFLNAMDSSR